MKNYDHKKIEKKWQKEWEDKKIYNASNQSKKKKFYSLIEFPYPSGDGLHVGHPRPYIGMDIISRKRRMEGYNVLYPIGWDAFGLPTENYAIKTGQDPRVVTKKNSDNFRKQIKSLGISFDWSREINTTHPKYYKWTQWIFLQFLKKGLAYKAKMSINWCPKDKIGLANEEVVDGKCERCGTPVEKREKEQWMLAITKYAERLDKDLDLVDYPDRVKIQQRNWIGKSEGAEIDFSITDSSEKIKVFTTRADTLFGATYMVLAPEHPMVQKLKPKITNWDKVLQYVVASRAKNDIDRTKEEKEKTGVELKGVMAVNPATGDEIPVWIADYVLATYGTGAIMAVPAHDQRDFEFAKKYALPIKSILEPVFVDTIEKNLPLIEREAISAIVKHWAEDKYIVLKWKKVNWHTFVTGGVDKGESPEDAAIREIKEETGYQNLKLKEIFPRSHSKFYHTPKKENRFAHFHNFYFELINGEQKELSSQEKENHEILWFSPDEIKQVLVPEGQIYGFDSIVSPTIYTGEGILINSGRFDGLDSEQAKKKITDFVGGKIVTKFKLRDWVFSRQRYWGEPIPVIHCPKCGTVPVPEKDLPVELPKVKNYQPTDSGESPLAIISKWVNVKCPKCNGKAERETDTMPNWAGSSWYYLRYTDHKNNKEFASKKNLKYWTPVDWYNGGMEHTTLHLLYSRFWHKFLYDLKLVPTLEPYKKRTSHGLIMGEGGVKMSKSLGNVVNPNEIVSTYGADTMRVYEMFMGPFEEAVAWSTESIIGSRRFVEKVWRIGEGVKKNLADGRFTPEAGGMSKNSSITPASLTKLLHKTIKKVSQDIENMRFNTAISAMMILSTEMEKMDYIDKEDYKKFLQILAPFAPHMADELWQALGEKKSIHMSGWPTWDEKAILDEEIKIAVQVNGKVRGEIMIDMNESEEEIKNHALADKNVSKYLSGTAPKKIIYVKNRLINIVI